VLSAVVERLAQRRRPQPGEDLELLGEPVEALAQGRERDGVGLVFGLEPTGADTEFHTATAHLINLGHRDGQWSRVAEGRRRHHRAQSDGAGFPRQARERHPGIGRAGQPVAGHRQIVVRPEKRRIARPVGGSGDRELIRVGAALLGFDEDAEIDRSCIPGCNGHAFLL
jgi:hypothetical protein